MTTETKITKQTVELTVVQYKKEAVESLKIQSFLMEQVLINNFRRGQLSP